MVALTAVLFLVGRYLPGGFVVAFFGAVPLALLAYRHGLMAGAVGASAALVVLFALGGSVGLSDSVPHAVSGPLMGALIRNGSGWVSCALAGLGVRLLYYPPVFFFYVYLVLGGVEAFAEASKSLLGFLDQYLGVLGISLQGVGAIGLFLVFLVVWSAVAGILQSLVVSFFLRRVTGSLPEL
jgi:hypothetical protein